VNVVSKELYLVTENNFSWIASPAVRKDECAFGTFVNGNPVGIAVLPSSRRSNPGF